MDGYGEWVKRHLTAFGLSSEAAVLAAREWEAVFDALLCDVSELHAATAAMLARAVPVTGWLDGHRAALIAQVRAARAALAHASQPDEEQGACVLCGGSGRVIVPRADEVRAGYWVGVLTAGGARYHTCAVTCSCRRGRFGRWGTVRDRDGTVCLPMTLEAYQHLNPGWPRQLAQHQREQVAEAAGGRGCESYDAALTRIRQRSEEVANGR